MPGHGRVTDASTKAHLTGATVALLGSDLSTTVQRDGTFLFSGLPSPTGTAVFNYIGYAERSVPYTLAADGSPTFLSKLGDLSIRDRITPAADGRSLTRTLTLVGRNTSWETHILLADAATTSYQVWIFLAMMVQKQANKGNFLGLLFIEKLLIRGVK